MWWLIHLQFMGGQTGFQLIEAKLVPFEEDHQHINKLNSHPNDYVTNIDFNLYGDRFLEEQEAVKLAKQMAWNEKGSYLKYRQRTAIPETILPKLLSKRIGAN